MRHFPMYYGTDGGTCEQSASETTAMPVYGKRREPAAAESLQKQRQSRAHCESYATTSSRSLDEIVLDLLRGKITHCHRSLRQKWHQKQRQIAFDDQRYPSMHKGDDYVPQMPNDARLRSQFDDDTSTTHSVCDCKVLIVVDYSSASDAASPTLHWVVQLKAHAVSPSAKCSGTNTASLVSDISNRNYLSCLESIQLYRSEQSVLDEQPSYVFSNRAWFLLENLVRHAVRSGADVLLKEFVDCPDCR